MTYEKILPPAYLINYVRYFWAYDSRASGGVVKTLRPITDGCPGIIIQLADNASLHDQDKKQLPLLCLYGQTVLHREIHASDYFNTIGVCFAPIALKSIFGIDADGLTDTCTDLNLLSRQSDLDLSDQLSATCSTAQRIELISSYLWTQIQRNNAYQDNVTEYALAQLLRSAGSISLKELQEKLNISERSLERRFKQGVGISPKLFSRICRFQVSLHQLKTNNYAKLSDIAFEHGYADQSHFTRVFREFAGFSPYQYNRQSNEIVENLAEWL